MNAQDFDTLKAGLFKMAADIEAAKRPGYTQASVDVLHNFKTAAAMSGVTPLQAFGVYLFKHVQAIMSRVQSAGIPQAEDIRGRFADCLNYLPLGLALIADEEEAANG